MTHPQARGGDGRIQTSRAAIFLRLVASYWTGSSWLAALVLTGLLLAMVLISVRLQALVNIWNAAFFNALEARAQTLVAPLLWQFAGYVLAAGVVMVLTVLVRMVLQVQVRQWVTTELYTIWLSNRSYLRLDRDTKGAETPEFRIADDVRLAMDQLIDLSVGFFTSLLLALTFFEVLARVGGGIRVDALGFTVPAYFLVAAVLYALMMSGISSLVGWPLVGRIQRKNHLEGQFRYELMRVREDAPSIAANGREKGEARILDGVQRELVQQWRRVLVGQAQVSGVASANAVLVGIFPIVLAIPKYMTGEMSLGAMMQIATAFVQVQMALNWIVDNFVRFAELRASANRVGELVTAMSSLGPPPDHDPIAAQPTAPAGVGTIEVEPVS